MADKPKTNQTTGGITGIKGKIIKPEEVRPGYTIRVHQKIHEMTPKGEEKERIQVFEGMVLGTRGKGNSKTMRVRKASKGFGVEKVFPIFLPSIAAIELVKIAEVRRAKLGFLKKYKKRLKERVVVGN